MSIKETDIKEVLAQAKAGCLGGYWVTEQILENNPYDGEVSPEEWLDEVIESLRWREDCAVCARASLEAAVEEAKLYWD